MDYEVTTCQGQAWTGLVGSAYTDRNTYTAEGLDDLYLKTFGITRTELNLKFLGALPRDLRILEVGCNIGMQLRHLQMMGFKDLHGIDLQQNALDRLCVEGVETRQGSATALPYADQSFDLVFTSGVLIHIPPGHLLDALTEITRCTKRYIWGLEHFYEVIRETREPEWKDMLWAADYPGLFLGLYPDMELLQARWMPHLTKQTVVGHMYLLARSGT